MTDLFRTEAVNHAARRLHGEVIINTPPPLKALAAVAIVACAAAIAALCLGQYSRRETVVGWVVPKGGIIRVTARQGGVLEHLHVRDGEPVSVGQKIASIRLSPDLDTGDSYAGQSRQLDAQADESNAQLRLELERLRLEDRQALERMASLQRETVAAERRYELQGQRVELAEQELERAEALALQGYLSRRDLDSRRLALNSAQQEASATASSLESYARQRIEAAARHAAIPLEIRATTSRNAVGRSQLEQQRTQLQSQSGYVVTSTVSGRIATVAVNQGQQIAANATVAIVTAENAPLEIELYAPSSAAGFVKRGQEVRLMYNAFPHQKFGTGRAIIRSVSSTTYAPAEVTISGAAAQEPLFRIQAELAGQPLTAYGQPIELKPGMLLTADIILDRRSLLEWLLDPLYAAGRR